MLAAQMQESADKAMAAVSVVITAARPVAGVGKMLEHQIEQLHRLRDLGFRHWFERSDPGNERTVSPDPAIRSATYYGKLIGSTKIVVMLAISRKGLARHLRELRKARRPTVRGFRGESLIRRRRSAGARRLRSLGTTAERLQAESAETSRLARRLERKIQRFK
jgi:hypothetical protein